MDAPVGVATAKGTMEDNYCSLHQPAHEAEPNCDHSSSISSSVPTLPQHLRAALPISAHGCSAPSIVQPRGDITASESMSASKRSSDQFAAPPPSSHEPLLSAALKADAEPSSPALQPAVAAEDSAQPKKKRRVSFSKNTKPPSSSSSSSPTEFKTRCPFINQLAKSCPAMQHSFSCTSLPQLASESAEQLIGPDEGFTGELDLNVSPSSFVHTIVLQSKSLTDPMRGEDVIADASERVKSDSYFLTYTHDHLDAYTNDKVNAVQGNDVPALRALHRAGHLMQASNRFGESMLHTSCRRGFGDVVDFFLNEAGVSPRVRDDMGRTPMHDACWSSSEPNHEIMRMLIGAAPEMLLSRDKRGHSPFDYARREYWPNWVAFLNDHRQFIVRSLVSSCLEGVEGSGILQPPPPPPSAAAPESGSLKEALRCTGGEGVANQ